MDRLKGIETLVAIADTGTFRRAAMRLGLSPPMATTHINRLEERLGVKLLHRTTRRLALTEQGRIFVDDARILLDGLAGAESRARGGRSSPAGRVRIDAPASLGSSAIVPALPRLRERYPDIVIQLTLGDRGTTFRSDGFDIMIRVGEAPADDFVMVELGRTSFVLVASPEYLARRGMPDSLDALPSHDCVLYSSVEVPGGNPWRLVREGVLQRIRLPAAATFNEGRAIADAAIAGMGIAQTLEMLVRTPLADGRLVEILSELIKTEVPVVIMSHPERYALPAVAAVMEFLVSDVEWACD